MNKRVLSELITRYFNGQASAEEESILMNWYQLSDSEPNPLDDLSAEQRTDLEQKIFLRIRRKINNDESRLKKIAFFPAVWYLSASIAAILLIGFMLIKPGIVDKTPSKTRLSADIVVINKSDRILKHIFPDKSIAWLKPAAELHYKRVFARDVRNVSLKGEAFFEVTHHSNWPFIINSGKLMIKVLGTSFNVKAPKNGAASEVSVMTGKVLVYLADNNKRAGQNKVFLLPKEKVVYKTNLKTLAKQPEDDDNLKMWDKSTLVFDNVPIANVIKQLNQTFDISISVKDNEISEYKLNADLKNVNLATILEILQTSLDITYEINDKKIILKKNETNQSFNLNPAL